MSASDLDLIRGCRKGDARSWEELLDKYERLVFSIPLRYGLSREDAADVSQLVFTILLQNLESLPDDSRLGPWLSTVTRRHTWRLMERSRRERPTEKQDLGESAVLLGKDPEDDIERWEMTQWLNEGLSLISDRCRELLTTLYFQPEQPSYAETAAHFGIPVGSVGPTRARCLKDLRKALLKKGAA